MTQWTFLSQCNQTIWLTHKNQNFNLAGGFEPQTSQFAAIWVMWSRMLCGFASLKFYLSTSSLILPSYTIRAAIFGEVFQPKKFPKSEYFATKRIISLSSRACKLNFPPWIHFNSDLLTRSIYSTTYWHCLERVN